MGKDLNPRQLRFVTELLKTGIQSRAYLAAGYHPTSRESLDPIASRLARNAKVRRELDRRKRQMLKKSDITIEKLLSDAEEARKLAIETKQVAAATGAGQFQAKLVGLLIDRKESGAPGDFQGLTTPAEIIAAIRLELGEDAANALAAMVAKGTAVPPPPEPVELVELEPNAPASGAIN